MIEKFVLFSKGVALLAARASALTDEDFKAFCRRVLSRRRQLPERAP